MSKPGRANRFRRQSDFIPKPGRPSILLAAANVRPSKSRGQNFLVQPKIADRIVACAGLEAADEVIEIGPGLGILSERIALSAARKFTMVEYDRGLATSLESRFGSARIVCADVLDVDLAQLAEHPPIKIIGNLPFNAAAAILHRLCAFQPIISRMVLMFQREVAERIRAGTEQSGRSALSVFTALYWHIDDHFRVLAGSFHPRPKVDAEVLVMSPRDRTFSGAQESAILATVRAAFSAPRKAIRNGLTDRLGVRSAEVIAALTEVGIDSSARPATVETDDFIRLTTALVARCPAAYAAIR
ncbi:MAG: ribosomal RNA small subunit methyltransferase A [Candidatus Binataceae bacterium]|nr:ribosomal RNA small subunit methyltransferase A [Candidatus Binataceae bacterium]